MRDGSVQAGDHAVIADGAAIAHLPGDLFGCIRRCGQHGGELVVAEHGVELDIAVQGPQA